MVFPIAAGLIFLLITRRLSAAKLRRFHPLTSLLLFLAIALPWHVLATLRNPPHFEFTLRSGRACGTDSSGSISSTSTCCDS